MLEIDSAFDEHNLGFGGFMKFLQSAPEIVKLYQVKQTWHAKAEETGDKSNEITLTTTTTTRLLAHLEELGWMLTSCIEGLKDLQEFIKSPDFLANPIPNKCVYRERRQTLSVIMQTVGHTLSPGKTFSADPSYYRKFVLKTPSF